MQKIKYPDNGSRAQRVLEALTPKTGATAPTINADYIGQLYVDSTAKVVYVSVAVGSAIPANDWETADAAAATAAAAAATAVLAGEIEALTTTVEGLTPLTGAVPPAAQADYIGQTYVDATAGKIYIAVAIDSVAPADDWKEITLAAS